MSKSIKHYAFAALALTGVYSAQLSIGFFSPDDAARTIAQVEGAQQEVTLENVVELIRAKNQKLLEEAERVRGEMGLVSAEVPVEELKEIYKKQKEIKKDLSRSSIDLSTTAQILMNSQDADFDRSAIEGALLELEHSSAVFSDAFDFERLTLITDEARDFEAIKREKRIEKLQGLLCEQNREMTSLKDELSQKLEDIRELVSAQDDSQADATSAFATNFPMSFPWTQLQQPFAQQMNPWMSPFSFMFGGQNQQGFGGYTQNNFYGQTSFNAFALPQMQMMFGGQNQQQQQQSREPSQVISAPPSQGNFFIPNAPRNPISQQESFTL